MLGVDPELGASALRLWVAAGSAALLVVVCVLAFARAHTTTAAAAAMRSGAVVVGAVLGAAMAWAVFDHAFSHDQAAERQALTLRAEELTARAFVPGSALACLDAMAGETVGAACEKAIFATPATAATAISYVAARFTLLADVVGYARRGGANIDDVLLPLRRSLEADRFGFLAHTLAIRDGCTGVDCKALALLRDPTHVRANLSEGTLDRYLDHYQTAWAQLPEGPVAETASAQPGALTQLGPPGSRKVLVNIDFPTAASIPPVSIINPEPKAAGQPAAAAAGGSAPAATASSSRRTRKEKEKVAPAAAASAPPSPDGAESQAEPVWTPAPAAPPQAAAPSRAPAASVAAGGAPLQLSPFASPPDASAGTTTRTQ